MSEIVKAHNPLAVMADGFIPGRAVTGYLRERKHLAEDNSYTSWMVNKDSSILNAVDFGGLIAPGSDFDGALVRFNTPQQLTKLKRITSTENTLSKFVNIPSYITLTGLISFILNWTVFPYVHSTEGLGLAILMSFFIVLFSSLVCIIVMAGGESLNTIILDSMKRNAVPLNSGDEVYYIAMDNKIFRLLNSEESEKSALAKSKIESLPTATELNDWASLALEIIELDPTFPLDKIPLLNQDVETLKSVLEDRIITLRAAEAVEVRNAKIAAEHGRKVLLNGTAEESAAKLSGALSFVESMTVAPVKK